MIDPFDIPDEDETCDAEAVQDELDYLAESGEPLDSEDWGEEQ